MPPTVQAAIEARIDPVMVWSPNIELVRALCPPRRYAVYFVIWTSDLLDDAQIQVVARADPADAAFAVDAQQGAVLGPSVAGGMWSDHHHASLLQLCRGGGMAAVSDSAPR